MTDRWSEEWQAWRCADCDPDVDDYAEDPDAEQHTLPYVLLVPMGDPHPDFCPRCGGYLSFTESDSNLRVTNTLADRWLAKQQRQEGT